MQIGTLGVDVSYKNSPSITRRLPMILTSSLRQIENSISQEYRGK